MDSQKTQRQLTRSEQLAFYAGFREGRETLRAERRGVGDRPHKLTKIDADRASRVRG